MELACHLHQAGQAKQQVSLADDTTSAARKHRKASVQQRYLTIR